MKSWAYFRATLTAAIAVLVLFAGRFSGVACACDRSPMIVADANERFTVSGTVVAVNWASNTMAVKAGSQNVEIVMTPTTVVDQHGETGSVADIRKGAKVSVSGVVRSGKKVALSIVLK